MTINPYETPTKIGTDDGGMHVFGFVAAKIIKHRKPVANASTKAACNPFSTLSDKLFGCACEEFVEEARLDE